MTVATELASIDFDYKEFARFSIELCTIRLHEIYTSLNILASLLDLFAVFDTIDLTILLRRLDDWLGVTGKALNWFKWYLTVRCHKIRLCQS